MIRLKRLPAPAYLSTEKVRELTNEFKSSKANVWNHEAIKKQLLSSSHEKCAYCEAKLDEESKFMEVEHFQDKDSYADKVVEWSNLLPACKRCNGAKGTHDVVAEAIVDPYSDSPADHLFFRAYRFRHKSSLGYSTIGVLDLNNSDRVVLTRFRIGEAVILAVQAAQERLDLWESRGTTRARNALIGSVEALLRECQPYSEYAATAATVLHDEPEYAQLMQRIKHVGLWSQEIETLHLNSLQIVL